MITLKTWNSLPQYKRKKAIRIIFGNMSDWYIENMSQEWHHNLDAEHKVILSSIYEKKDGNKPYYVVKVKQVL